MKLADFDLEIHRNGLLFNHGKQVEFFPTPNMSGSLDPISIVDHDTASHTASPMGPVRWLQNPQARASAHVCIDYLGVIRQLVPFNRVAWHAGPSKYGARVNYNAFSIGIEHDNSGWLRAAAAPGVYTNGSVTLNLNVNKDYIVTRVATPFHGDFFWQAYSEAQLAASEALHIALKKAYPKIDEVVGHYHICPGRKTDVNPLFPLTKMQSIIAGGPAGELKAEAIKPVPAAAPATEKPALFAADATVTADSLNLRGGPGTNFAIKGAIPYGTRIDVQAIDQLTGWYRVMTPFGATGFVHSGFVKLDPA